MLNGKLFSKIFINKLLTVYFFKLLHLILIMKLENISIFQNLSIIFFGEFVFTKIKLLV
jgi:hypothetical protein